MALKRPHDESKLMEPDFLMEDTVENGTLWHFREIPPEDHRVENPHLEQVIAQGREASKLMGNMIMDLETVTTTDARDSILDLQSFLSQLQRKLTEKLIAAEEPVLRQDSKFRDRHGMVSQRGTTALTEKALTKAKMPAKPAFKRKRDDSDAGPLSFVEDHESDPTNFSLPVANPANASVSKPIPAKMSAPPKVAADSGIASATSGLKNISINPPAKFIHHSSNGGFAKADVGSTATEQRPRKKARMGSSARDSKKDVAPSTRAPGQGSNADNQPSTVPEDSSRNEAGVTIRGAHKRKGAGAKRGAGRRRY